jgi:AcrR family transcriptional regulator
MQRRSKRVDPAPRPTRGKAVKPSSVADPAPPAAPSPASQTAPGTDGRRERSVRSRALVLDALLALLAEGKYSPSMQEISDRAGVSRRLVFHLFQDAETMHAAFVERQQAALRELFVPIPESLPLPTRLLALCEQRARVYERIAHTRRAGMAREHESPIIKRGLTLFRALKRAQVAAIFSPEIRSCHDSVQSEISAALGCAASFNTWESLRAHQQLSVEEAQRTLVHLLTGILRLTPAGANLVVLLGPKSSA